MLTDRLYDLAFRFRKTKLWKKLYDSQLFAVKHADGSVGYCCVMGMNGEHLALAVYPGKGGMDSYRLLLQSYSVMDDFEHHEMLLSQNCVMCSFEKKDELRPRDLEKIYKYCDAHHLVLKGRNAYPQFQRFRPHYFPWYLDDEADQMHLLEGLEACLEVSCILESTTPEEMGFTGGEPFGRSIPLLEKKDGAYCWSRVSLPSPLPTVYPSPEVGDDITVAKLNKVKKQGGEWACNVFMHVQPISNEAREDGSLEEPINAPFFPYLLVIVDNQSGLVLNMSISSDPEEYANEFLQTIVESLQDNGIPTRILVQNKRTRALFYHLAKHLEMKVLMKKRIPYLDEALDNFFDRFSDDSDEDELMSGLIGALGEAEQLRKLPDEVMRQLAQAALNGAFPEDIAGSIRKECQRRGL